MQIKYTVPLKQIVQQFDLRVVYRATDFDKVQITVEDVSRPGLQLAGFFDHFEPRRICVLGTVENTYLQKLASEDRTIIFDSFLSYKIPALVYARNYEPSPECLAMAEKHDVTILQSADKTSHFVSVLIPTLAENLAPRITRHGVLVEVYGEGILITGESGIGKSEAAIELIKRGHRLIADDAVEIRRISQTTLVGAAPEVLKHYIELRGIGVVNAARLFGIGAVKDSANIDLVVNLVHWSDGAEYDRLGLEDNRTDILGIDIPCITVPVTPGRNLAVIFEVAAMNNRQKKMGINSAEEFTKQLNEKFGQTPPGP
ncbi:MAG: HPr(Ser) kinase/phosphatase [Oscillospiraceae bacterium]|nr:HPr(Ser) kinase/phosphatase [Oscillospiraceae bacterium]